MSPTLDGRSRGFGPILRTLLAGAAVMWSAPLVDRAGGIDIVYHYISGEEPDWDPTGSELCRIFSAAASYWEPIFLDSRTIHIDIEWDDDLADDELGLWTLDPVGRNNIELNSNYAWWADPTPYASEEFSLTPTRYGLLTTAEQNDWFNGPVPNVLEIGWRGGATLGSGVGARHDLLSVCIHELGHELGVRSGVGPVFPVYPHQVGGAGGVEAVADPEGGHLAATTALMWTSFGVAERCLPSAIDSLAVAHAAGYTTLRLPRAEFINNSNDFSASLNWIGGMSSPFLDASVRHGGSPVNAIATSDMTFDNLTLRDDSEVSTGGRLLEVAETLTVDGIVANGPRFVVSGGRASSEELIVGRNWTGALSVEAEGELENYIAVIGDRAASRGAATVTGDGSTWTIESQLRVGATEAAHGELTVSGGGFVSAHFVGIGNAGYSLGTVTVEGAGSTLRSYGHIFLGDGITAMGGLTVQDSGTAVVDGSLVVNELSVVRLQTGGQLTANGDVVLEGGRLIAGSTGSGLDLAPGKRLWARNYGEVDVASSYELNRDTSIIIQSGSSLELDSFLNIGNGDDGSLTVEGGSSSVMTNAATPAVMSWGLNGGAANITLRDGATGHFWAQSTRLAADGNPNSRAFVHVQSGAAMTAYSLHLGRGAAILIEDEGILHALDNIVVDGGTLDANSSGSGLDLAEGHLLTAQNEGLVSIGSSYDLDDNTTFTIESGADLFLSSYLDVGNYRPGALVVDGSGSTVTTNVTNSTYLDWGMGGGTADVTIRNHATADFRGDSIRMAVDANAASRANVYVQSGAHMWVKSLQLGGGAGAATFTVSGAGAYVGQSATSSLTIGGVGGGNATLRVQNSAAFRTGSGNIAINPTGSLHVTSGGILDAYGPIHVNGGAFELYGGTLYAGQFVGSLENLDGTLAPGHAPVHGVGSIGVTHVVGDYTQRSVSPRFSSLLAIDIAGKDDFDRLNVDGGVQLQSRSVLAVDLLGSYIPALEDAFEILTAGGGLGGTQFSEHWLPSLTTYLAWSVEYRPTSVSLRVIFSPYLEADFDQDGDVDGADLARWRSGCGITSYAVHLDGDADGDCDVDGSDFLVWQRQLGSRVPLAAANASVPEPAGVPLLLYSLVACVWIRMRAVFQDRGRR